MRTRLRNRHLGLALAWSLALFVFSLLAALPAGAAVTERVSVNSEGAQLPWTDLPDFGPASISGDGRYVVFSTWHALVPNDTNGSEDVYLRDRRTNTTEVVSVSRAGEQGNDGSGEGDISADGRYVVFSSWASNLVPGDVNGLGDVFLRDRLAGTTELISVNSAGEQANGSSWRGVVTDDGRYVYFLSTAPNLVSGVTPYDSGEVFVRDRWSSVTEWIPVDYAGDPWQQYNCLATSAYGRFLSLTALDYSHDAWAFVIDRMEGIIEPVSVSLTGGEANAGASSPDISVDGRYVVFRSGASNLVAGDTNSEWDTFLRDRAAGVTERVSVSSTETEGGNAMGADRGFTSVGVSADGRYVCFTSMMNRLVPEWWDSEPERSHVYLRDRVAGTTELVDVTRSGGADSGSGTVGIGSPISYDGRCIAFVGSSSELVPGDTNGIGDIFVRDLDARFHDVSSRYWAFNEIEACIAASIVVGYPDNTYRPKTTVTRDQMAVFISRALAGGDELVPTGPATASFTDVLTNHWAFKYVEYAVDNGVVAGYPDGTYRPSLTVTRDAMAVFVARAMVGGEEYVPTGPATAAFTDVLTDHWAFKYIEYLRSESVVGGYPDGTYRPAVAVTRDQMTVYIQRAFALPM